MTLRTNVMWIDLIQPVRTQASLKAPFKFSVMILELTVTKKTFSFIHLSNTKASLDTNHGLRSELSRLSAASIKTHALYAFNWLRGLHQTVGTRNCEGNFQIKGNEQVAHRRVTLVTGFYWTLHF